MLCILAHPKSKKSPKSCIAIQAHSLSSVEWQWTLCASLFITQSRWFCSISLKYGKDISPIFHKILMSNNCFIEVWLQLVVILNILKMWLQFLHQFCYIKNYSYARDCFFTSLIKKHLFSLLWGLFSSSPTITELLIRKGVPRLLNFDL